MELGSTSLSTSACNDSGNSTLQPKHKTFSSHSGAQKGFVEQLCVDLERCDLSPFFDKLPDCLPKGRDFPERIFEAIDQCEVGVVVLSEEFFTSKWCMLELVAMANVQKRKPSFRIMRVDLGISLPQCHDVDNHLLSSWHIWAGHHSRIDLTDLNNALQLLSHTNALKYNSELGEVNYREEIVEAISRLVLLGTRFEDSHIQKRSRLRKVINGTVYRLTDSISNGAVYQRPGSNKYEPRIRFPVTEGMGVKGEPQIKSKRVPLGSYNTKEEGIVVYQIAFSYCKKPKQTCYLDLGGGDTFPIPAWSVDPNLTYEKKVKQVGDQVLKVYKEFNEQRASRNLPPRAPGLALEMPIGESQLLATSPIQQLRQPLNSGMDSAMQCQGFEFGRNAHNRVDFNNPSSLLLLHTETQHELLSAYKQQIKCLKAQVSQTEVENMRWDVKYSELKRKYSELQQRKHSELERKHSELKRKHSELEQRNLQLEHENWLLNHLNMQSQHSEEEFDTDRFLAVEHEESLAGDIVF